MTDVTLEWSDLERLRVKESESDPDHLFDQTPDQRRPVSGSFDPESVSLFLSFGSKINRLTRSDSRLFRVRVNY